MVNKLLVVGTSSITEQLFKIALMDSNIEIKTTKDHIEAEEFIFNESPDLVFVDPGLKSKNVMEFSRQIKDSASAPVILLKGMNDNWDSAEFKSSKADDILNKPFDPKALMKILDKYKNSNIQGKTTTVKAQNTLKKQETTKPVKRSAISLLKKAELENAKKFISSNLSKKTKTIVAKTAKPEINDVLMGSNISLTEEALQIKVDTVTKDIVERIAWEVVPQLAENIIRDELKRLTEE